MATALICAGGALAAVTARGPAPAGLWGLVSLLGLSGSLLVLGAEVVALTVLIVQVVGVGSVLLLALLLARGSQAPDAALPHRVGAAVVAGATSITLAIVLLAALGGGRAAPAGPTGEQTVAALTGVWVWPLSLVAVVLLVAVVIGVAVVRATRGESSSDGPAGEAAHEPVTERGDLP